MKQFKVICLSLMLFSLTLFAQESIEQSQVNIKTIEPTTSTTEITVAETPSTKISIEMTTESSTPTVDTQTVQADTTDSISTLITEIKDAQVEDRRVLMNQLKVQLREMNKESRQKAMMELKQSFSSQGYGQHKHQHQQNLQEQQSKHQPQYRQLRNGQRASRGNRHGHGHK